MAPGGYSIPSGVFFGSINKKTGGNMKATWEKVFEYASMPLHGSLSRKLRKGIKIQVNEGKIYEDAVLFLGEEFVRFSEENESDNVNTYYDWSRVDSIRTYSAKE